MKIGAHVSAAGELALSLERGAAIGANCVQIFISPPQQWHRTVHSKEATDKFKSEAIRLEMGPNFIHGTYLMNLATQDPAHLERSVNWLTYGMQTAAELGVEGVIFHVGSHKGAGFETVKEQIVKSLKAVLASSLRGDRPYLLLETAAGAGGVIGRFSELAELLKAVNNDRLKICLDTQHTFALGYDLTTKAGVEETLKEFDETIGLDKLAAIHCNDSKVERGSLRDRHENIGEGLIGKDGFKYLLNHPALANIPFLLEVPGFAGTGPDKENIDILKALVK